MVLRLLTLVSLLFLSQASLAQQLQTTPDDVPETCPITRAPALPFIPPWPYPLKAGPGEFWFGTDSLWTALRADGTWRGLPHYTPSDPTFRQKIAFWLRGYVVRREPQPKLTVTGRRLDSPAPPLLADKITNNAWVQRDQSFMGTGINLPTLGCWGEITGHYRDEELTFVVWVAE
jgi:hypothetical protein